MTTKHYYAMHTPDGNAVNSQGTPIRTVLMFSTKHERDKWVTENAYNTRTGEAHQTRTITEHEARVIMLRQCGRAMLDHQNHGGITWIYREYAQYCPTYVMADDYAAVIGYATAAGTDH